MNKSIKWIVRLGKRMCWGNEQVFDCELSAREWFDSLKQPGCGNKIICQTVTEEDVTIVSEMKVADPVESDHYYESAEYREFIEDATKHCICQPPHECPCAGVLAGGLCDRMGVERDTADYSEAQCSEQEEDP